MTIDTACSSSMVGVHEAVQALRSGTSSVAVACGTNLLLSAFSYITESKLGMLSPTGKSRMWDIKVLNHLCNEYLCTAKCGLRLPKQTP